MLRIDRSGKSLKRLEQRCLPAAGIRERTDLQQMIRNSPNEFFAEMGETLLLIGEEIRPAEVVDDRIDLLAIDEHGATVVIELKRSSDKLQLLQSLTYAGMVSKWEQTRLVTELAKFARKSEDAATEDIEEFILENAAELNQVQRIVLIAEDYDYEVLATAEWLSEKHDVDIRCYRLGLSCDGPSEYLACTCVYPPPELTKASIRRGRIGRPSGPAPTDWESALANVQNKDLVAFFQAEVAAGAETNLADRVLMYRIHGKRRYFIGARQKMAYVWQNDRFPGDIEFWVQRLGSDCDAEAVNDGQSLRFYLRSAAQFKQFRDAVITEVHEKQFGSLLASGNDGSTV